MPFISQELQTALSKVSKKFPGIIFDKHLVCLFIGKMSALKKRTREEFYAARKQSLKECGIGDEQTYKAYESLASTFFGKRGGLQKGRRPRSKKERSQSKKIVSDAIYTIELEDESGQYCFDI